MLIEHQISADMVRESRAHPAAQERIWGALDERLLDANLISNASIACVSSFTALHSFGGGSDGPYPAAGLIQASVGNLYGVTANGAPTMMA